MAVVRALNGHAVAAVNGASPGLCTAKLREMFPRPAAAFGTAMPSSGIRLSDS